jgi:hypothetical protein
MLQLVPAPSELGQLLVWEKFPPADMPVMFRGVAALFFKVMVRAALVVPTGTLPKATLSGEKVAGGMAVPKTESVAPVPEGRFTAMVPLMTPNSRGSKVTFIVQVALAARVLGGTGQSLVCA